MAMGIIVGFYGVDMMPLMGLYRVAMVPLTTCYPGHWPARLDL